MDPGTNRSNNKNARKRTLNVCFKSTLGSNVLIRRKQNLKCTIDREIKERQGERERERERERGEEKVGGGWKNKERVWEKKLPVLSFLISKFSIGSYFHYLFCCSLTLTYHSWQIYVNIKT